MPSRDSSPSRYIAFHINTPLVVIYFHYQAGDHELQNFAKTDFAFSATKDETKYGLTTKTIKFTTSFTDKLKGEMTIETIVFTEAGNITVESGETYDVSVGAVKFNIEIKYGNHLYSPWHVLNSFVRN